MQWDKMKLGRNVRGRIEKGRNVNGTKRKWDE